MSSAWDLDFVNEIKAKLIDIPEKLKIVFADSLADNRIALKSCLWFSSKMSNQRRIRDRTSSVGNVLSIKSPWLESKTNWKNSTQNILESRNKINERHLSWWKQCSKLQLRRNEIGQTNWQLYTHSAMRLEFLNFFKSMKLVWCYSFSQFRVKLPVR